MAGFLPDPDYVEAIARPYCEFLHSHVPEPKHAARLILATYASYLDLHGSSEPYRAAAYRLGWSEHDGSPWWAATMDLIDGQLEDFDDYWSA